MYIVLNIIGGNLYSTELLDTNYKLLKSPASVILLLRIKTFNLGLTK